MAEIASIAAADGERVLTARVAGLDVAFPAAEIGGAATLGPLAPVPRAPQGVAGMAAIGDRVATVIDLARCLGGEAAGSAELAVTAERGGHLYAFAVDAMGDVRTMPDRGLQALDDALSVGSLAQFAAGSMQIDGRPVLLLQVARLLDPELLGTVRPAIPALAPARPPIPAASAPTPAVPPPASLKGPLIDRLGGMPALAAAIADLAARAAADPELAPLVAAADPAGLETALRDLAGMLFGAPVFYAGPPLARLAELGMDGRRFDGALRHLTAALRGAGAGEADIAEAVATAERLRPVVTAG